MEIAEASLSVHLPNTCSSVLRLSFWVRWERAGFWKWPFRWDFTEEIGAQALTFISYGRDWGRHSHLERIESGQAPGALAYTSGKCCVCVAHNYEKQEGGPPGRQLNFTKFSCWAIRSDGFSFKKFSVKAKYSPKPLFYRHLHLKNA